MSKKRVGARGPWLAVLGIAAIGQRAFLTLWRQPVLFVSTMVFPVVYLLVLGNAMNRPLQNLPLAVVDEAGNAWSAECRRGVLALESGRRLVTADFGANRQSALEGMRKGHYRGIWVLPFGMSPSGPAPSFIGDNTDRFSYDALETSLRQIWQEVSAPSDTPQSAAAVRLEAYPYLDYLTYLGPAVVCLAIFMGSMVSGGLQVLEDRMFGYHEGYLVTPISTGTLVAGHILAGSLVASVAGGLVLLAILLITPLAVTSAPSLAAAFATVFLTSLSIAALWFLIFARARSASLLRGMFGIINVLLFFPSGAFYPVESYPAWLVKLSLADPLTYGLRALRNLLLRGAGPETAYADWLFLGTFTVVCGVLTKVLFRREV
ncbi:MAG TPA: ABC transporter permease [Thermoanaerobaculia bacterium]|jgi:ABC-2 type transport system permease protein|nr:ABC transporter permease [Thermoanaerobaculia bacterium]